MSGDRQWTILRPKLGTRQEITSGPVMAPGEFVEAVEASRLAAVEAERDAYRETLEWFPSAANEMRADPYANADEKGIAEEAAMRAEAVLARFPKNETEQG